jgi:hypothetical protein
MNLGRLWQPQGKRTEANELLASIYGWFTEGVDTADLQEEGVTGGAGLTLVHTAHRQQACSTGEYHSIECQVA